MRRPAIFVSLVIALSSGEFVQVCEARVWMLRQGKTLEGEFVSADLSTANIVDAAGWRSAVKVEDLSIGDRQFLVERLKADPKVLEVGSPGNPERECRIDEATFEKPDFKAEFGPASYSLLKTEHFVIAYDGKIKPEVVGETAERLWQGMAFRHADFRERWGVSRMLIVIAVDTKNHSQMGDWYFHALLALAKEQGQVDVDEIGELAGQWFEPGSVQGPLLPSDIAKYGAKDRLVILNLPYLDEKTAAMHPNLVHFLSRDLLDFATGGVNEADGGFTLLEGYAYYKEIQLTGSATILKRLVGSDYTSTMSLTGFESAWSVELRNLINDGKAVSDLQSLLKAEYEKSNATTLAEMYPLISYMHRSNLDLSRFDHLISRVATDHKVPAAEEIARIYGFDSVVAFNKDWTAFILSSDFK